jgi:hypothetical protein
MAGGQDARVAVGLETSYGTPVVPSRFLPLTGEDLGYTYNRYESPAIGTGRWARPSIVTTQSGSGSISGDVTSTGMGYLLQGLHGNTVTGVQQGASAAYLQTHTLDTPPNKSYTFQVQTPPVNSNVLVPHNMNGAMFGGITFSWSPAGVLSYNIPIVFQTLDLTQTNVAFVAPAAYELFSFKGGQIKIGGVTEANIVGDGSLALGMALRDDAFALGSGGLIAKPAETDKPTASGTFTSDFNGNTNLLRVINNTTADVVMLFEGSIIASTFKYALQFTIPDCTFTTPRATVGGPGPLQETITFAASSSTGNAPSILYTTNGATL